MDSDFQQQQYQHHFQDLQKQFHHQKQQVNNLTRFRSAPSSYFASFFDAADTVTNTSGGATGRGERGDFSDVRRDFSNARPLSPETENIFARFMSSMGGEINSLPNKVSNIPENPVRQPELMVRVKQENDTIMQQQQQQQQHHQQHSTFNTSSQMIYHSSSKPPLANQHISASGLSSPMGRPTRGIANSSTGMDPTPNMKIGIGGSSNSSNSTLTRHSSSPAGFFDNLNIEGYGVIRGMGNFGSSNTGNDPMNFSSGQPSSATGLMTQNSDTGGNLMRMNNLEETKFSNPSNNQNNDSKYMSGTGFPMSSWDDSILSDKISNTDQGNDDRKTFSELNASDNQNGEGSNRPPLLAHHLSLPKTSAEIAAMEKLMQFQDSVPCRIRAKRGFATHPRSIAERVRRTKISERMRKLQDLVPNMDKQTNTADMLDLAVEYIKDLQQQVKVLDDNRARCTCSR